MKAKQEFLPVIHYSEGFEPTPWWVYADDEWKETRFTTLAEAQAEWPEAMTGVSARVAIYRGKI